MKFVDELWLTKLASRLNLPTNDCEVLIVGKKRKKKQNDHNHPSFLCAPARAESGIKTLIC